MRAQNNGLLSWAAKGVAVTASVALAGAVLAPNAVADTSPPAGTPQTVTADVLPTVQVDGVVWSTAVAGSTVVAVGRFTKARPAGVAAGGAGEVTRSNIMAFNINTGALSTSFVPSLNGQALTVEAAPDGSKVYVGGDFTTVNGVAQARLAAIKVSDGSLDTAFRPTVSARVNTVAVTNSTVYAGGNFFNANSRTRNRLAAFQRSNASLLAWNPSASDGEVYALATAGDRVVVGGKFATLNGAARQGIGAVDATSGASVPWSSQPVPTWNGGQSWVTHLIIKDGVVYGTANGEGWHWFDGRFAAQLATGDLVWLDNCYGASYGLAAQGDALYVASHSHDCSSLGGFPEMIPKAQRALAETLVPTGTDQQPPGANSNYSGQPTPSLLHWFPTLTTGSATGQGQAAWTVSANDKYVVYGGEFPSVNGTAQAGLVRFAVPGTAPKKQGPQYTTDLIPTGVSTRAGSIRVAWKALVDRDNNELTYELFRDSETTPISTTKMKSAFWTTPAMGYLDDGLAVGSSHTYKVRVTDANGNAVTSPKSQPISVGSTALSDYAKGVLADHPDAYWRLSEPTGTSAVYDSAGFNDATASAGVGRGGDGAIIGDTDTSSVFSGASDSYTATKQSFAGPNTFAVEAWVNTTSTSGGKILGFGNSNTDVSSSYDRHLYMDDAGRIWFGVYPNEVRTVNSAKAYNDGQWHHIVGTLSPAGLVLYVDGKRVGQDPNTTWGQDYAGYWRLGGDNLNGWPNQPSSSFLNGRIDDVAIYPGALSWNQVAAHYTASGRSGAVVPTAPSDAYGKTVYGDHPDVYFRLNDAAGSAIASDSGPNGIDGGVTGGVNLGVNGGVDGSGTAASFNGSDGGVYASSAVSNPSVYSEELWFNTTTTSGGKLIGFGNQAVGFSGNYDRHVYMSPDGRLNFGVWTGQTNVATTPQSYNDGQWHHVVATQTGDGMKLYVDGSVAAANAQTQAQPYSGYWRVGGDNSWDGAPYFAGTIDEVAVYSGELSAAQVNKHWLTGSNQLPANQKPTASFTAAKADLAVTVDGSGSTDPDGTVASYAWSFGDGASATGATPAAHTYAAAGTYQVTLTVTDDGGATDAVTKDVTVTAPNQKPTASFTAAKADLAVTVDGSGSTDPDGTVASYAWSFGDGASATGATPAAHTYAAAGTYQVTLTVTDDGSATDAVTKDVAVTAPVDATFALDRFARSVTGGWGTAEVGGDWTRTGTASAFAVANGQAELSLAATSGRSAYLRGVSSSNTDLTAVIGIDKVTAGGALSYSLAGRSLATDGDYRVRVRFLTNGTLAVGLVRTNASGTETLLKPETTLSGVTYKANDKFKVRLQVTGTSPTSIRAKVWPAGGSEPSAWLVATTDATAALQAPGGIGLHAYLSGSATNGPVKVFLDDLKGVPAAG